MTVLFRTPLLQPYRFLLEHIWSSHSVLQREVAVPFASTRRRKARVKAPDQLAKPTSVIAGQRPGQRTAVMVTGRKQEIHARLPGQGVMGLVLIVLVLLSNLGAAASRPLQAQPEHGGLRVLTKPARK